MSAMEEKNEKKDQDRAELKRKRTKRIMKTCCHVEQKMEQCMKHTKTKRQRQNVQQTAQLYGNKYWDRWVWSPKCFWSDHTVGADNTSHHGGIYVNELRLEKGERGNSQTEILWWLVRAWGWVGRLDLLLHLLLNLPTELNSLLKMSALKKNLISTYIFRCKAPPGSRNHSPTH